MPIWMDLGLHILRYAQLYRSTNVFKFFAMTVSLSTGLDYGISDLETYINPHFFYSRGGTLSVEDFITSIHLSL
jgi:hypothetical protein